MSLVRVCSFESRRAEEMERLISRFGGVATMAPSMKEVALERTAEVDELEQQLLNGQVAAVVFLTGVGTEALFSAISGDAESSQHEVSAPLQNFLTALGNTQVIVRGPKPSAVLNRYKVRIDLRAPEPNTWHELAQVIQAADLDLHGRTVAVQEYGEPSEDFYVWLREQGAEVLPVPIYRWALPDDTRPLQHAVERTTQGDFDILLWTSAQQVIHTLQVAEQIGCREAWLNAANDCFIASIGPTASERLQQVGLPADFEPSHPKMAHLVRESIEKYNELNA